MSFFVPRSPFQKWWLDSAAKSEANDWISMTFSRTQRARNRIKIQNVTASLTQLSNSQARTNKNSNRSVRTRSKPRVSTGNTARKEARVRSSSVPTLTTTALWYPCTSIRAHVPTARAEAEAVGDPTQTRSQSLRPTSPPPVCSRCRSGTQRLSSPRKLVSLTCSPGRTFKVRASNKRTSRWSNLRSSLQGCQTTGPKASMCTLTCHYRCRSEFFRVKKGALQMNGHAALRL